MLAYFNTFKCAQKVYKQEKTFQIAKMSVNLKLNIRTVYKTDLNFSLKLINFLCSPHYQTLTSTPFINVEARIVKTYFILM